MTTTNKVAVYFDALNFSADGQAQRGAVNVDCLSDEELQALVAHPAVNDAVRSYGLLVQESRKERLAGRIDRASRLEDKAERLYTTAIPKHLRW